MEAVISECEAIRKVEAATRSALDRLRNPKQLVVSWLDVASTKEAVETVLAAVDAKLRRLTAALDERESDPPPDLRNTAENAVAQLRVALEWAALSSDGGLFRRVQGLVDRCEEVLRAIQSSTLATATVRQRASEAWRLQLARLSASPAWLELGQLRESPAWRRLVSGPGDVFELLKLGYVAKARSDPSWGASVAVTDDSIDSIRWHVSQLACDSPTPMQHVRVTQVDGGPLQAYVCVRHRIRGPPGSAVAAVASCDSADVMLAPGLPPGYSWEPCGAAVLFVSVWTDANLRFWKGALDPAADGLPGAAHGGFLRLTRDVWPRIVEALSSGGSPGLEYLREGPTWLLGHSMGAALAILCAPRLLALLPPPSPPAAAAEGPAQPQVRLQITGSPRVLDAEAGAAFDALAPRIHTERHYHPGDVIDSVPPALSWGPGRIAAALAAAAALARDPDDLDASESRERAVAAVRADLSALPADVFGFRHVGTPLPRALPREEVGWVSPWGAWAGSGFAKLQARRLHDASAYRRSEDAVPLSERTRYPWWVQLALGGAALWAARRAGGRVLGALRWQRGRWASALARAQPAPFVQSALLVSCSGQASRGDAQAALGGWCGAGVGGRGCHQELR